VRSAHFHRCENVPLVSVSLSLSLSLSLSVRLPCCFSYVRAGSPSFSLLCFIYPQDIVRLGGVPRRGDVGFLTLQEAYGYYEVGEHYKTPRVPIWVVYSESHYSILLSPDLFLVANTNRGEGSSASHSSTARCSRYGSFLAAEPFDLYYWDMLADQDEVVRLTVTPNINGIELPDIHDKQALIPPLDLVVRTKWPGHLVGWNGTDAIL
jgi:hypothetical protein